MSRLQISGEDVQPGDELIRAATRLTYTVDASAPGYIVILDDTGAALLREGLNKVLGNSDE